jgi:amino-acid N-acetyltransferase
VGLLRSLAVAKAYRRQGLATQLVNKIEEYARSQKVATLYLLTLTAENFFSGRGYKKIDRKAAPAALQETTEFKSLCPQTAVCMKKRL